MSLPPNINNAGDGNPPLMHKAVTNLIKKKNNSSTNLKRSNSSGEVSNGKEKLFKSLKSGSSQNLSSLKSNNSKSNIFDPVNMEKLMSERLKFFNLDIEDDAPQEKFTDPKSKHFSRDFDYKYDVDNCIPFETEGYSQQAKYLCHVIVNLYISISSKDFQGIIPISAKDISSFKSDIEMVFGTDMLQLNTPDDDESVISQSEYNTFEDEASDDELDREASNGVVIGGKINVKSSTIVNVVYWTTELSKCLHFEIPVSLRKSLCIVYYNLALSRGQKINRALFVDTFVDLLEALGEQSYNDFKRILKQNGLVLDYKPLLDYFLDFLPDPEATYQKRDLENRNDHTLLKVLMKLSHNARPFFDDSNDECLTNITQFVVSSLAPKTVSVVLPIVASFVPFHFFENKSCMDLFKFVFAIWKNSVVNDSVDVQWFQFLADMISEGYTELISNENPNITSKSNIEFGEFGFLNEEQVDFILNRLRLSMVKENSVASFTAIMTSLVFSINSEKMMTKINNLLNSMATYFHPSNTDVWSSLCAKFVASFIRVYHERCKLEEDFAKNRKELYLTPDNHAKLVDMFQGPILVGSMSKDTKSATHYCSSLAYLLDINPPNKFQLMDTVLLEVYTPYPHSIERESIALKQFGRIARFYCSTPIYRMHITNVMTMIINKIDANDPEMCIPLLNCLLCIVAFTPVSIIEEYKDRDFYSVTEPALAAHLQNIRQGFHETEYNDEFKYAFGVSTTLFKPIVEALITKLFSFVPSKAEENELFKVAQLFLIMIESMDKNMFDFFSQIFISHLDDESAFLNCKDPNVDIIAEITGYMLKRDTSLYSQLISMFAAKVDREVEKSKGNVRSKALQERDNKMLYCVRVLDEVFRCGMAETLQHKEDVEKILFKFFNEVYNPPIDMISPTLIHNLLFTLVYPEIIDFRLFPDDCKLSPEEKWGGFSRDDRRFSTDFMNFKWHLPGDDEVNYAIDLSKRLVQYASNNISKFIANDSLSTFDKDNIEKNVMILVHTLSGLSEVFDPDYADIKKTQKKNNGFSESQNKEKLAILNYVRKQSVDSEAIENGLEQDAAALDVDDEDDAMSIDYVAEDSGVVGNTMFDDMMSVDTTPMPADAHEYNAVTTTAANAGLILGDERITLHKLFNSFGKTDSEKLADPRYDEIHELHTEVGRILHDLIAACKTKSVNDSELLIGILRCIKCWFVDRGREVFFGEENEYMIDVTLMENIQSLAHVFEPYTRTCLALRVHMDYRARVATQSSSRVISSIEKVLLNDLLSMCISPYPNISGAAQQGLHDIMKQLLGCRKICMSYLLNELEKSLQNKDELVTKSILETLTLPKISNTLASDYQNLCRMFDLLLLCNSHSNFIVIMTSEELLMQLSRSFKVPSSVCIFNFDCLKGIAPDDKALNIEIEAVTNAKIEKRKEIFKLLKQFEAHAREKIQGITESKPEDDVMDIDDEDQEADDHSSDWKGQLFLGDIIYKLQLSNEFPTDLDSTKQLLEQTRSDHPDIKQKSIFYFTNLVSNLLERAEMGYEREALFAPCYNRPLVKTIDTSAPGFREYYQNQLANYENPDFFVDAKSYSGCVALGWPLYALSSDNSERLNLQLKPEEREVLEKICEQITSEYLENTVQYLIKDKDNKSEFFPISVCFFATLIQLINLGICKSIAYEDMLKLCEKTFDRNTNANIITSGEIFAALMVASGYTTPENTVKRDAFIEEFMSNNILKNVNTDILNAYAVIFWWLPGQVDIRRSKTLFEKVVLSVGEILTESQDSTVSPALVAARINFARYLLMGVNTTSDLNQSLAKIVGVFNHPDDPVRKGVANILYFLLVTDTQVKFDSADHLMEHVAKNDEDNLGNSLKGTPEWFNELMLEQFHWISEEYKNNETYYKTTDAAKIIQTEFFRRASTVYSIYAAWVLHNIVPIPYYFEEIAKYCSILYEMKNACNLTSMKPDKLFENLGSATMNKVTLEIVLDAFFDFKNKKIFSNAHGYKIQLNFIQNLFSTYLYILTPAQLQDIVNYVTTTLSYQGSLEVREMAGKVLSGIVHTMGEDSEIVKELYSTFVGKIKKAGSTLDLKHKYVEKSKKNEAEIHGAVIGLSAVVNAFPYIQPIPAWIPESLSILSRWTRFNGFIGQTVQNAMTEFKKNRTDTWHLDKEYFTIDQLEDLEGVNWRSYYA